MKALLTLLLTLSVCSFAAEKSQLHTQPTRPDRDDLGDVISRFNTQNGYWTGIAFDGELLWGVDTESGRMFSYALDGESEDEVALPLQAAGFDEEDDESMHGICWDGEAFWLSCWFRPELFRVSRRGELLDRIELPEHGRNQGAWGVTWDGDNLWYILAEGDGILRQISTEGELLRSVDCSEIESARELVSIEWVPTHDGGHMWWHADDENYMCRLNVEGDEAEIIAEYEVDHEEAFGLTHDGDDLWYVTSNEDEEEWFWYEIDDGIEEDIERNPVIVVEPEEFDFGIVFSAELEGRSDVDITITNIGDGELIIRSINIEDENFSIEFENEVNLEPEEIYESSVMFMPLGDYGEYNAIMVINSNDPEQGELEINLFGINENGWLGIENPIPDIEIDEDFGEFIIADIDTVFIIPHLDGLALYVDEIEGLTFEISRDHVLSMESEDNFSGDSVLVVVTAGYAPPNYAQDIFYVTINPVNDLPTAFNLLSPEDQSSLPNDEGVTFNWEESVDVDLNNNVEYKFLLGLLIPLEGRDFMEFWEFNLDSNSLELRLDSLFAFGDVEVILEWWVEAISEGDTVECESHYQFYTVGESVGESDQIISDFTLKSIYPNPFNSTTTIRYSLPNPSNVSLEVYNSLGHQVALLHNGNLAQGSYSATFSGDNLPSGVYLVRLEAGSKILTKKTVLIK